MQTSKVFKRYEFISTPRHGYLVVPEEDVRSVFGEDENDWDEEAEVALSYCPQNETHVFVEEDDAKYLFVTRARQMGWDVDYWRVEVDYEVDTIRNRIGYCEEWDA